MNSVLTGVNVCDGLLPGEYRSRTLCLYAAVMSFCTRLFRSPCDAGLNAVDHTRTPGSPVRTVMSEIHDSPGWHTGAYTGCISVPAVIGKSSLYLSLQAQNLQQTSLIQCINVRDELSVPVGTEVHPALSQITILVQPALCHGCIRI